MFEGDTFVVEKIDQVKALTHPLRQRILERFAVRPRTTKQVADELGEKPTRLYYHVNALESAGLIRLVETRPKRGTTEKYFEAVARRFEIDPRALLGGGDAIEIRDGGLAVLDGLLDSVRSEIAELGEGESPEVLAEQALFAKIELRGTRESIAAARERIEALVRALESEQPEEPADARRQRLLLGWYPLSDSS